MQPSRQWYVFIGTHGYDDDNLHLSTPWPSLAVSEETIPRGNGSHDPHTNLTGASEVVAHALQGTALASPSLSAMQRRVDALIAQSEGFLKTTRAVTEAYRTEVPVENPTRFIAPHDYPHDHFDAPLAPKVARFGVDESTSHATSGVGLVGSGMGGAGGAYADGNGGGGDAEKDDDDILVRWRRRRMQAEAVAEVAKARTLTTGSHGGASAQPQSLTLIALTLLSVLL